MEKKFDDTYAEIAENRKDTIDCMNHVHDVVVVTNDEHHVLAENPESVLSSVQSGALDWHVDKTLRSNLVPVFDLLKHLVQLSVEV